MTRHLLSLLCLISVFHASAQDPIAILKGAYQKCQNIQNGYYEMADYTEAMSGDVWNNSFHAYFKRLSDDTISANAFHCRHFRDGNYDKDVLYTGHEYASYSESDSGGMIMENARWGARVRDYAKALNGYRPITNPNHYPLPSDSDYADRKHIFQFVGMEPINGEPCYRVKMNILPENDSTSLLQDLRIEYHFWINKADSTPVQYTAAFDMLMGQDTMYQFGRTTLTYYEWNNLEDESIFTLESIPSYIELKGYQPYKSPKLLPVDTIAPEWNLVNLDDDTMRLSDFRGQLVLIDFFYMWCYPCMAALPALQELHEEYRDKGVKVVGINPFDTKEDGIMEFLEKRDVNYTVLLGAKEVAKMYRVSGYPTMYLLDRQGKIIKTQVGYGEGVEEEIEEVILMHLE